jgi:hypothetical protein
MVRDPGLANGWSEDAWPVNRRLARSRRLLEEARSRFQVDDLDPIGVRDDVRRSWNRCAPILPSAQEEAPVDPDDVASLWEASPIRRAADDLVGELRRVAEEGDFVAAVTDGTGRIIWSWAGRTMARRAERVNFVPGGRWDERSAGTNAPGLALVTGRPAMVFSVEHWCDGVRDWVCWAAPVRGPDGRSIGVLDLSTTWSRNTPLGLPTVTAIARLAEHQVRALLNRETAAAGRLGLEALGPGSVTLDDVPLLLPLRQLELLVVLALRGQATLDELHAYVYGERPLSPTTLKAEISHMRRALGGAVASRPYRLTAEVDADVLRLLGRLRDGDVAGAAREYTGQLLPRSEAPFVTEHRHYIDVALRTALLRTGTPADLLRFVAIHPYDGEVIERAAAAAMPDDPSVPEIAARLSRAAADWD